MVVTEPCWSRGVGACGNGGSEFEGNKELGNVVPMVFGQPQPIVALLN